MPRYYWLIMLVLSSSLYAQQPTPEQIQEAQKQIAADPDRAKKQLAENPQLLERLSPEQREKVMQYIDSVKATKTDTSSGRTPDTTDSVADSAAAQVRPPARADSAREADLRIQTQDTLEVFGHHLFKQKFVVPPYTEIPDDYVIAPGDEILLRFWGRYNQERKYLIGKDGYVFIEPLNRQAYLIGMTYGALKAMVQRVSTSSPGVEGDVRIVSAHPLYVHVAGNALNPGTVYGPASYSFWHFLMMSKGPDNNGSVRDIRVSRKGKQIAAVDIYEFLKSGKKPIVALQNEDVIFFGKAQQIVRIGDLVKRPGKYEIKQDEQLGDLIALSGGFASTAFAPRIQIQRIVDIYEKSSTTFPFQVIDIDLTQKGWEQTALKDGDIVLARDMAPITANDIYIMGPGIAVPGKYSLQKEQWSASDLIKEAGGLTLGAYPSADLLRLNPDGKRTALPLAIFDNEAMKATMLIPRDSIITYHDSQFVEITMVKTRGFVRQQIQERYSDSLTLADVLRKSQGIHDGGLPYVWVKRTDDFGNISYHQYDIADETAAAGILLDKRDEVLTFSYRDFNEKLPVMVLAYDREPLLLDYSPDLTFEVIIHELGGLHPLTDSVHVEVCTPDFQDEIAYSDIKTYSLNEQSATKLGLIPQGSIVFLRLDKKKEYGYFITIHGEVIRPGRYPLLRRNSRLSDLFSLAGGLTERANRWGIKIIREGRDDTIPVE
ncbi:MAG: SLBB domain-containing protein, partial [Chitinispirillaceae bacterium]|nr:SLBB domain-containing protein [Chitinispirillaceae bacterium]